MAERLIEIHPAGKLKINFHPGQWKAWQSTKRFVLVLAGTQGGKSSFGPIWLYREIQRRGPGDYMVVTPTFPLLELKALPEFLMYFRHYLNLGKYTSSPSRRFEFSEHGSIRTFGERHDPAIKTKIVFGYAADPESLESATAKAAWLDEAGQKKFKLGSWEAIIRRLSLAEGRVLLTTTPYDLGWLKQKLWDQWKDGDPHIDVIQFDSTTNPSFPMSEFLRVKEDMPAWKFDLYYRAIFTRPAGVIYDCFDDIHHTSLRHPISRTWRRYLGLDFGGVNTAGLFYAEEPLTGRLFLYREYKAGNKTAAEHVHDLLRNEPMLPRAVGGSWSEDQWRQEFSAAGLPVERPPFNDVEVGIDRVYAAHRADQIIAFKDLAGYLEEKSTYAREVDPMGNPTEKIEDKETFHYMDAERYIISWIRESRMIGHAADDITEALAGYRGV